MPTHLAFGRWSQEIQKFKASSIYILSSCRPRLHETLYKKEEKSAPKLKIIS